MQLTPSRKSIIGLASLILILGFNNCGRVQTAPDGTDISFTKGVETGNPMTAIAALPKIFLNSNYPNLPEGHRVLTVGHSGRNYTDCQSAVNAAAPGDEVVIDARFVCSRLVLPDKGPTDNYIVIRSANMSGLPPEGVRISKTDSANLAVIESKNDEFAVGIGDLPANSAATSAANHYYLLGLEIRVNPSVNIANAYIVKLRNGGTSMDQLPHDIVIGRSWIHGNPDQEIRRGIDLNGLRISVIDSIIEDVHQHGATSQGIAAWDAAAGPYKITNNEFAVAGAALLIGWQSSIPNLISSDIEVRQNLFHKLDSWRQPVTSNAGLTGHWVFSESIILRSVQRILFDGNVFMNDWARIPTGSNYIGRAFSIAPAGFGQSWARVQDVTITNNIMHDIAGGFSISYQDPALPEVIARRIQISNNVAYNLDPKNDRGFIWLQGQAEGAVVFDHNSFLSSADSGPAILMASAQGVFAQFNLTNNIFGDQGAGILDLNRQFPNIVFHHNVLAGQSLQNYTGSADLNFFPGDLAAIGFSVDPSAGIPDFKILQLKSSSPYSRAASDGSDMGANIQKIKEVLN